jgi:polynucleotide 5'-kinase involved in rRNA processing
MKRILILSALFALGFSSASAQDSDAKGPEYKNRKASEIKSVDLVSVEQADLKGPKRKNAKSTELIDASKAKKVRTRARKEKGPKAKNKKAWN